MKWERMEGKGKQFADIYVVEKNFECKGKNLAWQLRKNPNSLQLAAVRG